MTELWLGVASNVAVAAILAAIALAVGRRGRRPALVHGLCLLALIKLVTPAWFEWSILPVAQAPLLPVEMAEVLAWRPSVVPGGRALESVVGADSAFQSTRWVVGLWSLGSVIVLGVGLRRWLTYVRLRRSGRPVSAAIQVQADRIAKRLGLRSTPRIRTVAARISPLVCPCRGGVEVLLPADLLVGLGVDERAALLTHEFAHVRRRDHWVRYVEVVTIAVYWWLPLMWWLRRELRNAEELCCDAWVVWSDVGGRRAYADALLGSVDVLSDGRLALPPLGSGMGAVEDLKHRLTRIMKSETSRRVGPLTRCVLIATAACLPALPAVGQARGESDQALRKALQRIERLEALVERMAAREEPVAPLAPPLPVPDAVPMAPIPAMLNTAPMPPMPPMADTAPMPPMPGVAPMPTLPDALPEPPRMPTRTGDARAPESGEVTPKRDTRPAPRPRVLGIGRRRGGDAGVGVAKGQRVRHLRTKLAELRSEMREIEAQLRSLRRD